MVDPDEIELPERRSDRQKGVFESVAGSREEPVSPAVELVEGRERGIEAAVIAATENLVAGSEMRLCRP